MSLVRGAGDVVVVTKGESCFAVPVDTLSGLKVCLRQVSGEIWKKSFKKVCGKALCHIAMKEERHGLFVMYQ